MFPSFVVAAAPPAATLLSRATAFESRVALVCRSLVSSYGSSDCGCAHLCITRDRQCATFDPLLRVSCARRPAVSCHPWLPVPHMLRGSETQDPLKHHHEHQQHHPHYYHHLSQRRPSSLTRQPLVKHSSSGSVLSQSPLVHKSTGSLSRRVGELVTSKSTSSLCNRRQSASENAPVSQ